MNKLIIDATRDKIFFMLIKKDISQNISHENTKVNFEKIMLIMIEFLNSNNVNLNDICKIYVNRGPGSFAGIRNSLSTIKAINLANKIDYYCYSLDDFVDEKDVKYENIPYLCEKFKIKKNLIKPIYIS